MEKDAEGVEIVLENKEATKEEPIVLIEGEDGQLEAGSDDLVKETDPDKAIKKLNKQLKKERKAREKAEEKANAAAFQVRQAYAEDHETKKQLLASAIDKLKTDNSIYTAQYAEAMSVNDYEKAAQIQQNMALNANKLSELEAGYDRMKVSQPQIPEIAQPKSKLEGIIEAVSQQSPKSAKWLKQNREYLDSDRMIDSMFNAHTIAVNRGIRPDTDEYFEFIEDTLGLRQREEKRKQKEEESVMSAAAKPVKNVPPSPAPVERYSNRPNVIRLTREEVDTAKMLGMTEKEYAANKLALQKAGRM